MIAEAVILQSLSRGPRRYCDPRIPKVCRRFRLCDAGFIPGGGGHTD
jgi:hypothetical protein